ncbi:MAG TPA: hypothetical protein DDZ80_15840 [Cyanobacteria bacterium UBA8803]|nr:hypothetical protein [Cyanobacteria bacterium UBA9273]HBL59888.1 hypothetical protein [Cyanobacteria bacterium UBA8803]
MTSTPPILERAKLGDAKAIASLLNRSLSAKGITAQANLKGNCLRVMLESLQVPPQAKVVQFVHQGLRKLQAEPIKTVTIYGRKTGQEFPAWYQDLDLSSEIPTQVSNATQPSELSDSLFVTSGASNTTRNAVKPSGSTKAAKLPKRLNQVLVGFLWLWVAFNSLFVLYSLVWSTSRYIYKVLNAADATGFVSYLVYYIVSGINSLWYPLESLTDWISWITIALFLVWLHRFHASLGRVFHQYPISPWGAVARFAIPFYSLWGIGNTLTTLANHFKSRGSELIRWGAALKRWIPWYYVFLIASNVMTQFYWEELRNYRERELSPWFFLAKTGTILVFSVIWLQTVRIMNKGMSQAISQSPSVESAHHQPVRQKSESPLNNFNIKAVIYGLLLDVIATKFFNFISGFAYRLIVGITSANPEQVTPTLFSYESLIVVNLIVGLLFTLSGGFLTARLAKKLELKHAFVMGVSSAFLGWILLGFQVLNQYVAIALLSTIPVALLGGYLYKSKFKIQNDQGRI